MIMINLRVVCSAEQKKAITAVRKDTTKGKQIKTIK
jgi:hypothetical protein